jgi:hypothetical protein
MLSHFPMTFKSAFWIATVLLATSSVASTKIPIKTSINNSLNQFGTNHPQCKLWTNWEKICSRTGKNGAQLCYRDRGYSTKPSAPFCVVTQRRPEDGFAAQRQDTPAMRTSRNRFCEKIGNGMFAENEAPGKMPNCERYLEQRPFNGTRASAIQHPLCNKWSNPSSSWKSMLYCMAWKANLPCKDLISLDLRISEKPEDMHRSDPLYSPVWGIYCN